MRRGVYSRLGQAGLICLFIAIPLLIIRAAQLATLGDSLQHHWQFLDLLWLAETPWTSLLLLHAQPPLMNALAAALLHLPVGLYKAFIFLNCTAAALTTWVIYVVLRTYLPGWLALAIATIYLVSPAVLLNAAYPFYPSLTAAGYAGLVYAFAEREKRPRVALAVGVLAIGWLSLLRSSFTPAHGVFFMILLVRVLRHRVPLRPLLWASAACLLLVLAVPMKNLAMFGFFGASSWTPLNLVKGFGIDRDVIKSPAQIAESNPQLGCRKSHGSQDRELLKSSGYPNFNSCLVLEYARMQEGRIRAGYVFASHMERVVEGLQLYLSPPDRYHFLVNRPRVEAYANMFERLFLTSDVGILHVPIRWLLVVVTGAVAVLAARRRDSLAGFLLLMIVVHAASHVLIDGDESRRFVFDIEFILYICLGFVLTAVTRMLSKPGKLRPSAAAGSPS